MPRGQVRGAGRRLDELSRSLGDLHSEFSQPELEELVALEQQLANLMEQTKRALTGQERHPDRDPV